MYPSRKKSTWLSLTLVLALLIGMLPLQGIANAEDTITGIAFESNVSPVYVTVEGSSVQLKVLGTVSGKTDKKDVTSLATWTTSNPSAVKVDAGWVSGVGKGTSEITVKYQGYTLKKTVVSEYLFDQLVVKVGDTSQEVGNEVSAKLGDKLTWKVFALDKSTSTNNDVTSEASWTSSSTDVADVNKGVITLKSKGKTDITIKHKGLSKKIELKVEQPYDKLELSPEKLIEFEYGAASQTVTAKAKTTDGKLEDVTDKADWTTSDANIAEVKNGVVKPINVGTATVTASYLGSSQSITVVVRASYQAMRITPDQKQHVMLGDGTLQVQTFVLNSADNQQEVTDLAEWTSSNLMAATVDHGKVYAKSEGTATITASYKGLTKSVEITVYPTIEKLKWTEEDKDAKPGDNRKQNLILEDVKPMPKISGVALSGNTLDVSELVHWTSSNESVVSIKDGKMKAVAAGTATLTANVRNQSLLLEVTVQRKALLLQANNTDVSVVTGREQPLPEVNVIYADGTEENVTTQVKWESSSPNLLVRDGKMKGLIAGRVTLTGTFSNVKLSIKVTVEEEIVKYAIVPSEVRTNVNKSQSVKVTGTYRNGKTIALGSRIKWTVENEKVATVRGATVKGVAIGSTKLVGEYQGRKLEVVVHVKPRLLKLESNPTSVKLGIGQSASWKVQAIYDTGEVVDVTSSVTFVPSNLKIKAARGTVQAAAKGSATLKFTFDGKSTSMRVSAK
ncbi:Ig-like domain-containing protein [Paenibacillus alvei]|uniref:Ig-like domain-containing protein n=1 Tax=Paenibacillus alvei TaxID=44250 RepID=A0ABT4GW75_PAEAL|nr:MULTISPECIES: Ig-like domain-containing protein [Paenibacillus]MCY9760960.1 Ig-like domain-containing protein [Paenibacillus alvei]MCY9768880.1 Ig-like domain-containing protein [Paenibacillus alvei]